MKSLFGIAAIALAATMLPSCSNDKTAPIGQWQSVAPQAVTTPVADATSVNQVITIDFQMGKDAKAGPVELTSEYTMTAPADSTGTVKTYKVTAKVAGTWTLEQGEDDDYILAFDSNTLKVEGEDAPELGPSTDLFIASLPRFSKIEDVKVSKDGKTMSLELDKPDTTLQFAKK